MNERIKGLIEALEKRQLNPYYAENGDEECFASAGKKSGTDAMEISVFGNEERILLTARYDNLGKGACGAAIECLNIVLGADRTEGMNI